MIDCGRVWLGAQQTHFFFMGIQQLDWDIGLTPKIPDPWLSLSLFSSYKHHKNSDIIEPQKGTVWVPLGSKPLG